VKKESLEKLA